MRKHWNLYFIAKSVIDLTDWHRVATYYRASGVFIEA